MADPISLCPTCHSQISSQGHRTQGADGTDSSGNPIPAWSDDPILTSEGFNGANYEGVQFLKASTIQEIQTARQKQESDAGVTPPTEFTPVQVNSVLAFSAHLIELRISTERILDILGLSLKDYFSLDINGDPQPSGPNDTPNKEEWTDVIRGSTFNNQGRNAGILVNNNQQFLVNATTQKDTPTIPANSVLLKAIHIEDLRHPLQPQPWKEGFSKEGISNTVNAVFNNQDPQLNLDDVKLFEYDKFSFNGDMATPYFARQIFEYQVAPVHTTIQVQQNLIETGIVSGGNGSNEPLPIPKPATPLTYTFVGQIPGVLMFNVSQDLQSVGTWSAYNIWQVVSPPGFKPYIESDYEHVVEHAYGGGVAHLFIQILGRSRTYLNVITSPVVTTHYSFPNWNQQPWKFWYLSSWDYDTAHAEAVAVVTAPGFLPSPNPSPPSNYEDTTIYGCPGPTDPCTQYDPRFGEYTLWMYEWDRIEYGGGFDESPLEYYSYTDNDNYINSGPSNFSDAGDPFLQADLYVRPWDFVPNYPDQIPPDPTTGSTDPIYAKAPVKFTDDLAIVITLSEKSYVATGITPEDNPVSNVYINMKLFIKSPEIPPQGNEAEQQEIEATFGFTINGPGTNVDGKKVFTIYLSKQEFDGTPAGQFINRRCYFSVQMVPEIMLRLSTAWHDVKFDQEVPSGSIPGDFWGTAVFVQPRTGQGVITIDSIEIKKVPQS